mmetsp:Transcript_11717/g.41029  ORF Transcript_11717/g.41029 Transcript_11717/m.41029 type:complete len:296 (+) Transcript_11717:931-1818(+)
MPARLMWTYAHAPHSARRSAAAGVRSFDVATPSPPLPAASPSLSLPPSLPLPLSLSPLDADRCRCRLLPAATAPSTPSPPSPPSARLPPKPMSSPMPGSTRTTVASSTTSLMAAAKATGRSDTTCGASDRPTRFAAASTWMMRAVTLSRGLYCLAQSSPAGFLRCTMSTLPRKKDMKESQRPLGSTRTTVQRSSMPGSRCRIDTSPRVVAAASSVARDDSRSARASRSALSTMHSTSAPTRRRRDDACGFFVLPLPLRLPAPPSRAANASPSSSASSTAEKGRKALTPPTPMSTT